RGVRRPSARGAAPGTGRHLRGLPASLARPDPGLAHLLDAQVRALSNLASGLPSPEARARLLGAPLEGALRFAPGRALRSLVRRRLEQAHGEVRVAPGPFELVEIDGHPGLVLRRARDAWLGRALVLNAPAGRLGAFLSEAGGEVPDFLRVAPPPRRRAAIQLRAAPEVLPEAMADRVLLVGDDADPIRVTVHPGERGARHVDLTASAAVDEGADLAGAHDRLEAAVRALLPFSEQRVARVAEAPRPIWDDELALGDPAGAGGGWPTEVEIRAPLRPPVFVLPREELAGLGPEGDLLLGWQAGDAIAAALPKPALG
ncbi:MAG TPA: hypothetical protein VHQ66_06280, partial [Myxococcota bacterium]|nr:hypothetical protein [Myxococcota bacterium]